MANNKKMKKTTKSNLLMFGFVIVFWAVIQLISVTGHMTSKLNGLLIPVCAYIIMAISLNLVVGFLGELSLGHAAFMSAGAFAGIFFYTTVGQSEHSFRRRRQSSYRSFWAALLRASSEYL